MVDRLRTICGQRGAAWATHQGWADVGEDCLNVNTYAPAVSASITHDHGVSLAFISYVSVSP